MAIKAKKTPAEEYIDGVVSGKLITSKLVRLTCERHIKDLENAHKRGFRFDKEKAERVIRFFGLLHHSKGEWAGQKFQLAPFQQAFLWILFGWVKAATGYRRFNFAYSCLARKQGKSTLASGVALYLLAADNEGGAEVYSAATKKDQARIVFQESTRMVSKSPSLRNYIKQYRDSLSIAKTASKYVPLASDDDSLDGLHIHGCIGDEVHAWKGRALWDVLITAMGARRQPLMFAITTAGYDRHSICFEQHSYSEKVLQGVIEDDTWFSWIAQIDPEDDWEDERVWCKANPTLGEIVKIEELRSAAAKAKENPAALNAFLRLRLNRWTESSVSWVPLDKWDACNGPVTHKLLHKRPCFGALDLATTTDIAAFVLLFPPYGDDTKWRVLPHFYLPEENIKDRVTRDRVPYDVWQRQGHFNLTPGNIIDYDYIRAHVNKLSEEYDIKEIAYDPWNATQIATQLEGDGFVLAQTRQGFTTFSGPMKRLLELVLRGEIEHGGNPVLRWMASNTVADMDPAGNIKPSKNKSTEKIDGIVALIMALARASVVPIKQKHTWLPQVW